VDFDDLNELGELFSYNGDVLVLACLELDLTATGEKSRGFAQLARAIVEHSGIYIPDGTISRSLRHLTNSGLIEIVDAGTRHPKYQLTELGTQKTAMLRALLNAMNNWKKANSLPDRPAPEG
jgi:DNA-binding HxlR family transcriptional regulator